MRRLTHQEFITRVKKQYPKLRIISRYRNTRTPIQAICKKKDSIGDEHGDFTIRDPSAFLYGKNNRSGCSKCANESRAKTQTRYHYDHNYFDIPNMENCYWAGFIAADGCITSSSHIKIKLSNKDSKHLQLFAGDVSFTGILYEYNRKSNFGKFPSSELYFSNGLQWITALENNFNIGPQKSLTYTHPDNLTDEQSLAFIKGYIDGDGHVSRHPKFRIGAIGTLDTLTWIQQHFDRISPAKSLNKLSAKPRAIKNVNAFYYEVGYNRAKIIIDVLAKLDTPTLERKWN